MPLNQGYGVLKGRAVERRLEGQGDNTPHYQVHIQANQQNYRIAINVKSMQQPFDLLYFVDDNFQHPLTQQLLELDFGLNAVRQLDRKPGGITLDYIRGNFFDVTQMKALPFNTPGPDNDLNDLIDLYIQRALNSNDVVIYAFGEPWGPENQPDKIFGFSPGRGIHNIHMNQGNSGRFAEENGVWQDGGLIIHYPQRSQWVGAFFAFQSQSFHTDDLTGNPLELALEGTPLPLNPTTPEVKADVKIIAALVNPLGEDPGKETVTLMNTSPQRVNLSGWTLADRQKRQQRIEGKSLEPGEVFTVPLTGSNLQLGNNGGIITLLNPQGVKIDGIAYTKKDAQQQGRTILF